MSQPPVAGKPDFDVQMKSLAQQALSDKNRAQPGMVELLRPLMQHMEILGRAMTENTLAIARLEEALGTQASLPRLMTGIHDSIEEKNQMSQALFDALHEELRSYKDEFLHDVFQRPIGRDLIALYDDLRVVQPQAEEVATSVKENGQAANVSTTLGHITDFVLEILARMEIYRENDSSGKLDKNKHCVVGVKEARNPEEDQEIVLSVRPGFTWRGRVFRAEEVIVRKWSSGAGGAVQPPSLTQT